MEEKFVLNICLILHSFKYQTRFPVSHSPCTWIRAAAGLSPEPISKFRLISLLRFLRTSLTVRSDYLAQVRKYSRTNQAACRSPWLRGLWRGSTTASLLGLRVRILPRAWKFVSYDCHVLSSRGFCDQPINCPEESCRLWFVSVL